MTIDISKKTLDLDALTSVVNVIKTDIKAMYIGKETLTYLKKNVFTTYKGKDSDLRYNNIPVKIDESLAFGVIELAESIKEEK